MLELNGVVAKIEKTEITNVDLVSFKIENNSTKMSLELVTRINPFNESDPVTIIFDTKPISKENPKLTLKGVLYSISKTDEVNRIQISVGGLQLRIASSEIFEEFKAKKDLLISFF